jgi:CheY-like chemotaxis protein
MATTPHPDARATRAVLVVDDVDATRRGLAELLRLRWYVTHEAKNGAEAMAMLRTHPDTGIVVLDLTMPGTSGFWFRDQQLKDPTLARIPVIVFTGSPQGDWVIEALDVSEVLFKPFAVDQVCEAIKRHCLR